MITSLKDYQKAAITFIVFDPALALHYLIPSLLVEILELDSAMDVYDPKAVASEVGDSLWMIACIAWILKLDLPEFIPPRPIYRISFTSVRPEMVAEARIACDTWLKAVRKRGGDLTPGERDIINDVLDRLLYYLRDVAITCGISLYEAARWNLDKLEARRAAGELDRTEIDHG